MQKRAQLRRLKSPSTSTGVVLETLSHRKVDPRVVD